MKDGEVIKYEDIEKENTSKYLLYMTYKEINDEICQIGYSFYNYNPKKSPKKVDVEIRNYSILGDMPNDKSLELGITKRSLSGYKMFESDLFEIMFYLLKVDYIIGYGLDDFLNIIEKHLNNLGQSYNFDKLKIIDLKKIKKSNSLEDLFNSISSTKTEKAITFEGTAKKELKLMRHIVNTQAKNRDIFNKTNIDDFEIIEDEKDQIIENEQNEKEICVNENNQLQMKKDLIKNSIYFSLLNKWGENEEALNLICTIIEGKQSIFLTGKAGTGKSTLIKDIIDCAKRNGREPVVTGTTGMAAVNVGGQTLHSFFELGISQIYYKKMLDTRKRYKLQDSKIEILEKAPFIIIDEVSMLRSDILDCLNVIITKNVGKGNGLSFGGKQIIFIGDIFQLAPIPARIMKGVGNVIDNYNSPRFFDSDTFCNKISLSDLFNINSFSYRIIELTKNYRNINDPTFSKLLDRVRNNETTWDDIKTLNSRVNNDPNNKSIMIATHNKQVDYMNEKMMSEIDNEEYTYEATMGGIPPHSIEEKMGKSITLKKGARIMLTNNDTQNRWVNGSMATITYLDEDIISVNLDKDGKDYDIERVTIYNTEYRLEGGEWTEKKIGRYRQFPVRIAYAITVNKSQGTTFDKIRVNLSHHFAGGQSYVAITRVKTLNGLILLSPVSKNSFYFDDRVIEFKKFMDEKIEKDKEEIINMETKEVGKKTEEIKKSLENEIKDILKNATTTSIKGLEKRYIFELRKGNYLARGNFSSDEIAKKGKFTVLKGSIGANKLKSSLTEYKENTVELWNAYVGYGNIIVHDNVSEFKEDCVFHSPIEAANIILGTSAGKLSDWINLEGEVLSEKLIEDLSALSDKIEKYQKNSIDISNVLKINKETEKFIQETDYKKLDFTNLISITDDQAELISKFKGDEILFGSLSSISNIQAYHLSKFEGKKLLFPGLRGINSKALALLCSFGDYRSELDLSGLSSLSYEQCDRILNFKGNLNLSGIDNINNDIAETLGRFKGKFLDLSGIKTLSNKQYNFLNKSNINLSDELNIIEINEDELTDDRDAGFDFLGIHKDTGTRYDNEGFDREGYNDEGINREGYDRKGNFRGIPPRDGYDIHGYDKDGYDKDGLNMYGIDRDGYNSEGFDNEGFDREGYNSNGYDRYGHPRGWDPAEEQRKKKERDAEIRRLLG